MAKSASKNSSTEQGQKDRNQVIAAFLVIQAIFLICLLIYYHGDIELAALSAVIIWAVASLGLAAMLIRPRLSGSGHSALPQEMNAANNAHIFGLPGKNLDLAGICSIIQEGVALLKHGHIIYTNPALAYILAAQEEEILGTRIGAYVHPEDAGLINLDGSGSLARATLRLLTRLGDVRWVICSTHNVDWQGEDAVLLLFENIGALRQAQQATAELEQQSRVLLERTPLGIAMFDSMGQLKLSNTAWNALWSSIVGNSGRRFNILQDPFLPNTAVEKAINQAFNKKDANISHFEHAAPWGETRWLNLNFHPMTDPMGRLIGVGMIQQDITDQIRSTRRENELNEQLTALRKELSCSESFLTQMQEWSKHVFINFEQDGSIAGWNSHAETRFRVSAGKAVGLHYKRLSAELAPYMSIIKEALDSVSSGAEKRIERYDEQGPHYENVQAYTGQIGSRPITILKIKDVTGEVTGSTMHGILSHFATISGIGRALDEVLDLTAEPPAIKPGAGAMEKFKEIAGAMKFMAGHGWPSTSRRNVQAGELMAASAEKLSAETPGGLRISKESADSELAVFTDLNLAASGIAGLGKALLGLLGSAKPNIGMRQGSDGQYAVIALQVPAGDEYGLTDLPGLLARMDEQLPGLEEDRRIKALLQPLLYIAACDGVVAGYSDDSTSGFVCRFRL